MRNALRYSMSAVFTTVATSYFASVGIIHLGQSVRSAPPPAWKNLLDLHAPVVEAPGTPLALPLIVREVPVPGTPGVSTQELQIVKNDQETLRSTLDVQMKAVLKVEEEGRNNGRRMDSLDIKVAEAQRVVQEMKEALDAAQGRIVKLESALKTAQAADQKAAMGAKKMTKMYANMTPEKAAKILLELPNNEAADVLARMKEAEVASILALFPPKRAASISARLSGGKGGTP
jgi:flagellar motility protein MotE (MotC chaperone)